MFCPKCGRMNPDEDVLCKGCGAPLHEEEKKEEVKKNNGTVKKVSIAVLILAAACAVAFSVTSCEKEAFLPIVQACLYM